MKSHATTDTHEYIRPPHLSSAVYESAHVYFSRYPYKYIRTYKRTHQSNVRQSYSIPAIALDIIRLHGYSIRNTIQYHKLKLMRTLVLPRISPEIQ